MVKVSVVIPVYNVAPYLRECLDSCVNQTLKDIEFICINDGSTDNSLDILNEYAEKDSRFRVYSQQNQGQGIARNTAIEKAEGKYLAFIDPDDWVELNIYERLYNYAEEKEAKVVKFNYTEYNDYSHKYKPTDFAKKVKQYFNYELTDGSEYCWRMLKDGCLRNLELHAWSFLYRTDFIKSNDIRFAPSKRGEDHLFTNGTTILADKIYYLADYLYYYRCRSGSAVNSKNEDNFAVFDNIQRMQEFLVKHSLYIELQDEFEQYAKALLIWNYEQTPKESIKRYQEMSRKYFSSDKEYRQFIFRVEHKRNFIENLFSLKNHKENGIKHKVITILGCEFHLKPRKVKEKV